MNDANTVDGSCKCQPATPSSVNRKRDAIVDSMLHLAAASKMRADAFIGNEERFAIKSSRIMDGRDIELDEMELVAAAAGYYYYNDILCREPIYTLSVKGSSFMTEVFHGPDDSFRDLFRMDKHVFRNLCHILQQKGMLPDTPGVTKEEKLGIFLNIIGHNERNRVIQDRYQHSGATVSRYFNDVLTAIKSLSHEFLQSPPSTTPEEILKNNRFSPYFKDCLGVIDGLHIPAYLPVKDQSLFRDKKGVLSQNVLAACTFDLQFIFVYPGWEGSVSDSRILKAVLDNPDQNFPKIPEGKYYLVDMCYVNTDKFVAPYHGVRYYIHDYRGANLFPRNVKELFNHRHACLRNAIQKSFHVLKERFPILNRAPKYAFHIQRDIVVAACVLHNFIRGQEPNDWLFNSVAGVKIEELPDLEDQPDPQLAFPVEQTSSALRDSIATSMWNDFVNTWNDEW